MIASNSVTPTGARVFAVRDERARMASGLWLPSCRPWRPGDVSAGDGRVLAVGPEQHDVRVGEHVWWTNVWTWIDIEGQQVAVIDGDQIIAAEDS
jgi:hypothetical protein